MFYWSPLAKSNNAAKAETIKNTNTNPKSNSPVKFNIDDKIKQLNDVVNNDLAKSNLFNENIITKKIAIIIIPTNFPPEATLENLTISKIVSAPDKLVKLYIL